MPHWLLEGSTYFVTFRTARRKLDQQEISLVRDRIVSGDPRYYDLLAAVVLPDHVHLLFRPKQGMALSRAMKGIKGTTARELNRRRGTKGKIWQEESFDRIVRSLAELQQKLDYMYGNPVKLGLAKDTDSYLGWYPCRERR
ncbi:transposase [Acidobacteriia bacterium AH_259_A11_L15]|nr:transposase [Acidobacteriia bacterium AH_259_A11_L15]